MSAQCQTGTALPVDAVRAALNEISDPCSLAQSVPIGLADMGMVVAIEVRPADDGRSDVHLRLRTTSFGCMYVPMFEQAAKAAVGRLPDVGEVGVEWASPDDWDQEDMAEGARERLRLRRARYVTGS